MYLGVSSSLEHSTPQEWAAKHVSLGLKCVNFPVDFTPGEEVYMAYKEAADKAGIPLYMPKVSLCTDNGAMIGSAAYYRMMNGDPAELTLNAVPALRLL